MQDINKTKKIIEKFILFLEEKLSNMSEELLRGSKVILVDEVINKNICETKLILDTLNFFKVMYEVPDFKGAAIVDFTKISEYFIESPLTWKEKATLLFLTIKANIQAGLLNNKRIVFTEELISSYDFKFIDKSRASKFLLSEEAGILYNTSYEMLDESQRLIKQEMEEFISQLPVSSDYIPQTTIEAYELINEHLFMRKDSFNDNDIKIVILGLKQLNVDEKILSIIQEILTKTLAKRENNASVLEMKCIPKKETTQMSEKEINTLSKELRKYFNFYRMEPAKVLMADGKSTEHKKLNLDEQIYCVSLMLKLGKTESEIINFLRITNKYKNSENPITTFTELYSKLLYYSDNENIKRSITNMLSIINQIMIVEDEEYKEWKDIFDELLNETLQNISRNYEYEFSLAKRRIRDLS